MDIERGRSVARSRSRGSYFQRSLVSTGHVLGAVVRHAGPFVAPAFANRVANIPSPSMSRSRSRGRSTRRSTSRKRVRRGASRSRSRTVTRGNDNVSRFSAGGRRRGGGRFNRRVMRSLAAQEPQQMWLNTQSFSYTAAVNKASLFAYGLYTTSMSGQTDLANIFVDAGLDTSVNSNDGARLYIKSAILDVELKNTGVAESIIDVYTILNKKTVTANFDMATLFDSFFTKLSGATGIAGATPSNNPAVSLFENPVFCQYFKILSKREMIIMPGELATMQMKIGKEHMVSAQAVITNASSIPKVSKFLLFSFHGPPDPVAGAGSTPGLASTSLCASFQKVYRYAVAPTPKQLPHVTEV